MDSTSGQIDNRSWHTICETDSGSFKKQTRVCNKVFQIFEANRVKIQCIDANLNSVAFGIGGKYEMMQIQAANYGRRLIAISARLDLIVM